MSGRDFTSFLPIIVLGSLIGLIIMLQIPVPESHSEYIIAEPISSDNELQKMRFDRFVGNKSAVDTHGNPIAVDTHETTTLKNKSDDESTISIKVFMLTDTGQKNIMISIK